MILTPLGHTHFLVDIKNRSDENIRILVDPWLSRYALGDLCERSVQVELFPDMISTIDVVYISHAHTDHFDPYTLVRLFSREQEKLPLLVLPFTLAYLVPLIEEYLPRVTVQLLFPGKSCVIREIEIMGIMFDNQEITNEDDVLMLGIANHHEILIAEIDTVPPETLEAHVLLKKIFTRKEYDTRCYLASRNELDGNIQVLDAGSAKIREKIKREYLQTRKEEIEWGYAKWEYEDYETFDRYMELPGFVRGYIGQGIVYPSVLSRELSEVNIFPLSQIVDLETNFAREYGFDFSQKAILPGRQYRIESGNIETGRKECSIGKLTLPQIEASSANKSLPDLKRVFAVGPLFPRGSLDMEDAKRRILKVLNERFLPYWSASPVASFRSALLKYDGVYRIGFKQYDAISKGEGSRMIFEYSCRGVVFSEISDELNTEVHEWYWIDDILDFLDGKQEMYSSFWHKLDPKHVYRLWTGLGANFCNNDLVLLKYRFHFERACRGETIESFFDALSIERPLTN